MDDTEARLRLERWNRRRRLIEQAGHYRRSFPLALLSLGVAVLAWAVVGLGLLAERGSGLLLAAVVTGLVLLFLAVEVGADSRVAGLNARIDALRALLEERDANPPSETASTASTTAGTPGTDRPGPAA
jgi:Flp pilus assembly protein TadB